MVTHLIFEGELVNTVVPDSFCTFDDGSAYTKTTGIRFGPKHVLHMNMSPCECVCVGSSRFAISSFVCILFIED